jgi:hypothetical protein
VLLMRLVTSYRCLYLVLLAFGKIELSLDYSVYSKKEYKTDMLNKFSELILDTTTSIPSLIVHC